MPGGIVILTDQTLRITQNRILLLDAIVRRQSALALAARHSASGGMEADSNLPGRADFGVKRRVVGQNVKVVGARGASRLHEFSHRHPSADIDSLIVQLRPYRIEGRQPDK